MVQNSCPGQRELLCLYWTEPGGYFYPSFNLYYRVQGAATYNIITGIRALTYILNGTQLNALTSYEVTITGVTFAGVESIQAPPATFMTSSPDPHDVPTNGVSNIVFVGGVGTLTYSFTPPPPSASTIHRYNVRIKCKKPSGHPYKIRKTYYNPVSPYTKTLSGLFSGSTCRVKLRFWYYDENSVDNAKPRRGPNMSFRNIVIQ